MLKSTGLRQCNAILVAENILYAILLDECIQILDDVVHNVRYLKHAHLEKMIDALNVQVLAICVSKLVSRFSTFNLTSKLSIHRNNPLYDM